MIKNRKPHKLPPVVPKPSNNQTPEKVTEEDMPTPAKGPSNWGRSETFQISIVTPARTALKKIDFDLSLPQNDELNKLEINRTPSVM